MNIMDVWPLVVGAVTDALNLDWSELSYKRSSLVIRAAAFIGAVFFSALIIKWRRNAPHRRMYRRDASSSHYLMSLVPDKIHEPGIMFKVVRGFVWVLAFVSLCFLGVALANPVVFITDSTEQIESREIIYVKDVSASNGFRIKNSNIPRGEIAQETLEKLILKRKDKRDRSAYVVFGTHSEIWSGFTTSFESLSFSVSMAPFFLAPSEAPTMWPGMFIVKKGQYTINEIGYGTGLHLGLESAIYLFDRKGSPKVAEEMKRNPNAQMRSVVIITDGVADVDPEPQFRELRKRRIIPYLIFIDPDRSIEKALYGENSIQAQPPNQLFMMVRRSGGQYFLAKDKESVDRISETLDRLQSVKQTEKINFKEREVYFIPLAVSFLFAVASMVARALSLPMWRTV